MDVGKSDSDKQWYWSKRGSDERNGPVSTKELIELAKTGDLRAEDTVWKEGMSDWRKAKSVSTLSMQDVLKESEEETPLPISEDEKYGSSEEDNFPIELEIEWGGSIVSVETTLRLHRNEVSLHTNNWANDEYSIKYSLIKIKEVEDNKVALRAPTGFNENALDKTHYFDFDSVEEREKFLDINRQFEKERTGAKNNLEKYECTKTSNSKNNEDGGSRKIEYSDERHWYKKKRYAAPLALSFLSIPFIFIFGIGYIITFNRVSNFKDNREKIISSIVQKKELDEAIEKSKKYENALNVQGEKDERLFNILDSLRNKKSKEILNKYEDVQKTDYDRRIELLESAKEYLSNVGGKKYSSVDQVNRKIEKVRKERDYPCNSKAGYYDGTYKGGGPSGMEMGTSSLEIEKSCEYEMYVDSDLMGEGTLSVIDGNEFEMDNGNILEIYNGTAVMMESGPNYNVGYKMYLQK